MIRKTVIFGKGASQFYDETGSLVETAKYIEEDCGMIVNLEFSTQSECDAYFDGVDDMDGWEGYTIAEDNEDSIVQLDSFEHRCYSSK